MIIYYENWESFCDPNRGDVAPPHTHTLKPTGFLFELHSSQWGGVRLICNHFVSSIYYYCYYCHCHYYYYYVGYVGQPEQF